jgi:hypothetical protein
MEARQEMSEIGCGVWELGDGSGCSAAVLIEKRGRKRLFVWMDAGNVTQPRRVFVGYGAALPCHGTFSDRIRPGIFNGFWPYLCVLEMRFETAIL